MPHSFQLSLNSLISPLNNDVWLSIIALLIISGVLIYLLKIEVHGMLGLIGLILGIAQPTQPSRFAHRIFFLTWALFGYLISQHYSASLSSKMLIKSEFQIETVEQLCASDFKLTTSKYYQWVYEPNYLDINYTVTDSCIKDKMIYVDDPTLLRKINELEQGKIKDEALMTIKNFSISNYNAYSNYYVLPETVTAYPMSFATLRGTPQLDFINKYLEKVVDSGLIKKWITNFMSYKDFDTNSDKLNKNNLNFLDLIPVFCLLLIGYIIATIILFVENFYFYYQNKKMQPYLNKYYNQRLNKKNYKY